MKTSMTTVCTLDSHTEEAIGRAGKRKDAAVDGLPVRIESPPPPCCAANLLLLKVGEASAILDAPNLRSAAKNAANCAGGILRMEARLAAFDRTPTSYDESTALAPGKREAIVRSTGRPPYILIEIEGQKAVVSIDAVEAAIDNVQRR